MKLFFRVSGIVLTLLVFLGCGVLIGAKRPVMMASGQPTERFQQISDTEAFDTKTGQKCLTEYVTGPNALPGFHVDLPEAYCQDLAKQ